MLALLRNHQVDAGGIKDDETAAKTVLSTSKTVLVHKIRWDHL
jgi:hypothetical protein